ncbi:Golgi-associated plant pathogenesis-related protein 1-like [Hippoglossus stenolepis]|uniref:Golgi-associated plant pathogenesis-related protein 1-like n=1 Tax=Hippoglossus stenolepis TaxID=195615 RepID=UPI001FAFCA8E|nr:Golgi-associated plant pathogenesis-related protein 1-like [Hippoglossus stenolepis]
MIHLRNGPITWWSSVPKKHSGSAENIYKKIGSTAVTGKEVVDFWYSEIKDYNWSSPGSDWKTVGHFTQVVWKDTIKLGVGVASVGTNVYVVAQYSPPGNMKGNYEKNVLEKDAGSRTA